MWQIPLLGSPIGWVVLGAGGYILYKAGKKKGLDEHAASQITDAPEPGDTKKEKSQKGEK